MYLDGLADPPSPAPLSSSDPPIRCADPLRREITALPPPSVVIAYVSPNPGNSSFPNDVTIRGGEDSALYGDSDKRSRYELVNYQTPVVVSTSQCFPSDATLILTVKILVKC